MTEQSRPPMPQSIEAEEAVLGAILIRQAALHEAAAYVSDADFCRPAHQLIFRAAVALDVANHPVDLVTLVTELRNRGELDGIGGASAIAELHERVPTAANVAAYARIVREKSLRRKLIVNATELIARAREDSDLAGAEEVLSGLITAETSVEPVKTMPEMVADSMRKIEETASGQHTPSVWTGLTEVDRMLGGLPVGWQSVLLARPRLGKSAMARTIAHNCLRRSEPVGVVDLEMRRDGLLRALIAREAGISAARLRRGQVDSAEWPVLVDASMRVSAYPLHIYDDSNEWAKIKLAMRRWVDLGCKLIVIDYLSKVEPEKHTGNIYLDVGRIAYEAHDFAHKFDVHVMLVVQQTRDASKEKDKRPKIYHARESGKIEESADLIFALYNPSEFEPSAEQDLVECWVLKAKDAATGMVELRFIPPTMEFSDWDGPVISGPVFDSANEDVDSNQQQSFY